MRRPPPSAWLLALLLAGAAGPADALLVRYVATDLPEAPSAPDRWRYDYTVDAFPYDAGWGFTIYFDPALYGAIETPLPAVGSGWDAVAVQPDPGSFDGFYDAQASIASPSVSTPFSVIFTWLGSGTPGAQPVELRDPVFLVIDDGVTVPEAGGATAVVAALAWLTTRRRRAPRRALLALIGALTLSACGGERLATPPAAAAPAPGLTEPANTVSAYALERARLAARAAEASRIPVADPAGMEAAAPDPAALAPEIASPDEWATGADGADG